MAKKKVDLSNSISASSNNLLNAGRGAALTQDLGALLNGDVKEGNTSNETSVKVKDIIENPFQPRIEIKEDTLIELSQSIESEGQLQPIIVQKYNKKFIVIAGHRRLAAHKIIKKETILATIIDAPYSDTIENNQLLFRQATIENIQRENLYPLELALACKEAIDKELYKSVSDISNAINKSKTYLSKIMSILKLSKKIVEDLSTDKTVKDLEALYELQKIEDNKKQEKLYFLFKDKNITRDDIRAEVKAQKNKLPINTVNYKCSKNKLSLSIDLTKLDSKKASELENKIESLIKDYI